MSEPLHIALRPKTFEDVIGQDAVVKSLANLFTQGRVPHSFLFTGPSGTGKTTLGRIIAIRTGCDPINIVEIDAARYSGIDNMREMIASAQFTGLGTSRVKVVIVDECHALSKATWQTLLLSVEEPKAHIYWVFCTTEPDKVPKTIVTRCHAYDLKPVKWDLLAEYLEFVALDNELKVGKEFIGLAARRANGSVRQGLVFLSMLDGIISKDEAARLVEDYEQDSEGAPIALARLLVTGRGLTWEGIRAQIKALQDYNAESARLAILGYAQAVLLNEKDEKRAMYILSVMAAFSAPFNSSERLAPLLLAAGQVLVESKQ